MLNCCNYSQPLLFKASVFCTTWFSMMLFLPFFFQITLTHPSNSISDTLYCCLTLLSRLWLDSTLIACLSYLFIYFIETIFSYVFLTSISSLWLGEYHVFFYFHEFPESYTILDILMHSTWSEGLSSVLFLVNMYWD